MKTCTMNCGPAASDMRSEEQRRAECTDCIETIENTNHAERMKTKDEIMTLVGDYADACAKPYRGQIVGPEFEALREAIDQLAEQAKWSHHQPKLLTEADAAADLAGTPRPGAEPVKFRQFLSDVMTAAGLVSHGKQCKALGERLSEAAARYLTAPPQASQPCDQAPAQQPLSDEQKQHIHNVTGAGHSLICLVESYILEAQKGTT